MIRGRTGWLVRATFTAAQFDATLTAMRRFMGRPETRYALEPHPTDPARVRLALTWETLDGKQ